MTILKAIAVLTLGNFVYQAFTNRDWPLATERSWFQAIALIFYYFYTLR